MKTITTVIILSVLFLGVQRPTLVKVPNTKQVVKCGPVSYYQGVMAGGCIIKNSLH